MIIVVDTNVLVSGLINPDGVPGRIVRHIALGDLLLCHDGRIIAEYIRVLTRKSLPFGDRDPFVLIDQILESGISTAGRELKEHLPHADDESFLEVALAGRAEFLVTGNLKHFPASACRGVKIVDPARFWGIYQHRSNG